VYMLLVVICLTLTLSDVVVQSLRERRHEPRTMTEKQKSDIVDEHNILRAQEGAADMELMTWSDTLAAAAKKTASKCEFKHYLPPLPNRTTSYGQNIYSQTGGLTIVMTVPVQKWYDEKTGYNYDTLECDTSKVQMCGHYKQVVWATSRQVGCAYCNCKGVAGLSSESSLHLVCNYLPGGKLEGAKPFKKGAACSKCASGAGWCKNGLCNSACSTAGKDCSCAAQCYNCAELDNSTCRCSCADGWRGSDCSVRCEDTHEYCNASSGWNVSWCEDPKRGYVRRKCPAMCNLCTPDPDAEAGKCKPVYGPGAALDADPVIDSTTSDANLTAYDANSTAAAAAIDTSSTASAMFVVTQPLMTMMMMMMMILSFNNIAAL